MDMAENSIQEFGGTPEGKNQLGKTGVAGRIILKWVSKRTKQRVWSGLIWFRVGTSGGLL